MDGTIVNTEDISHNSFKIVCAQFGGEFTEQHHRDILGTTGDHWSAYLIDKLSMNVNQEEFRELCSKTMEKMLHNEMHLMDGFERLVVLVKEKNIPFVLVTSSKKSSVERNFRILDLENPFDAWVTSDSVNNGKPDPEPFILGAEKAKIDSKHCIAIEDSYSGVQSAQTSGAHVCAIPGKYSSGLDFSIADKVFKDLNACVDEIERLIS